MKIALAQMNSKSDWKKNLLVVLNHVHRASLKGAQAVLFPENVFYMGPPSRVYSVAQEIRKFALPALFIAAKQHRISIAIGGHPEPIPSSKKVFNTSLWIDENGKLLGKYRKTHLFDAKTPNGDRYAESKTYAAGKSKCIVRWKGIRIGLSICFDIRFPEHYRSMAKTGVDWILIPAAFTEDTGKVHWHTLLKARAIENLVTVIAPAQTGKHPPNRKTYGHSLAISPWGKTLLDAGRLPGLYFTQLPKNAEKKVRRKFPVLKHL